MNKTAYGIPVPREEELGASSLREDRAATPTGPSPSVSGIAGIPLRWVSELFRPSRKCARLGHRMRDERLMVYLWPPEGAFRARYVADSAIEVRPCCLRCGLAGEPRVERREGINGLTLNGDRWDRLVALGRLPQ